MTLLKNGSPKLPFIFKMLPMDCLGFLQPSMMALILKNEKQYSFILYVPRLYKMENDLDIFRKREERKKKKKKSIKPVDYPKYNTVLELEDKVCFLGKDESGEALVYLTDGKTTECISTPAAKYDDYKFKGLIPMKDKEKFMLMPRASMLEDDS